VTDSLIATFLATILSGNDRSLAALPKTLAVSCRDVATPPRIDEVLPHAKQSQYIEDSPNSAAD
jgi:hypothetical protein